MVRVLKRMGNKMAYILKIKLNVPDHMFEKKYKNLKLNNYKRLL